MEDKLKLYLDTSVWNFALETERSGSSLTREFLELILQEEYMTITSDVVQAEILAAPEPRKSQLQKLIGSLPVETIIGTNSSRQLANLYVKEGLIPNSEFNDALHIAIATTNRCNFIVSWNFKHMVRAKVIMGVHHINHRESYGLIEIVSPEHFLGKKE